MAGEKLERRGTECGRWVRPQGAPDAGVDSQACYTPLLLSGAIRGTDPETCLSLCEKSENNEQFSLALASVWLFRITQMRARAGKYHYFTLGLSNSEAAGDLMLPCGPQQGKL